MSLAGTADTLSTLHKEHALPLSSCHYFLQKSVNKCDQVSVFYNNKNYRLQRNLLVVWVKLSTSIFGAGALKTGHVKQVCNKKLINVVNFELGNEI